MAIKLDRVANAARDGVLHQRLVQIHTIATYLSTHWRLFEDLGSVEDRISAFLNNFLNNPLNLTPEETFQLIKKASAMAYGDPQDIKRKQYSVLYHNPTHHWLQISAMDLKDENAKPIEKISPGGVVWIPYAYTKGGKKSTVHGVAPQLLPATTHVETMLDLPPSTWGEWVQFQPYVPSRCCGEVVQWLDSKQYLECRGCKKAVVCV